MLLLIANDLSKWRNVSLLRPREQGERIDCFVIFFIGVIMKTFKEWFELNPLGEFLSSSQVSNMETAWNAALDEAVKVADIQSEMNMDDGGYYNQAAEKISEIISSGKQQDIPAEI